MVSRLATNPCFLSHLELTRNLYYGEVEICVQGNVARFCVQEENRRKNKVERKKTRFGSVSLETSLEWFKKIPDYLLKFLLQ